MQVRATHYQYQESDFTLCAGEHHAYTWEPRNSSLINQHEEGKKSITYRKTQMSFPLWLKYAVVTGANKGIGFEVCRQLATQGITVVLTARNEKRGLEAVEKLKASSLSGSIIFHQLDVTDLASIASLAEFIKSQFGKLDILVNNAGIGGVTVDSNAIRAVAGAAGETGAGVNWTEVVIQTYDSAAECFQTNYYGAKRTAEALLPLLQLSDSPRIVNVSSLLGKLKTGGSKSNLSEIKLTQTYDLAAECLQINYYGAKRTIEALLPLLQLSDSPRIINVSSSLGKLETGGAKINWSEIMTQPYDLAAECLQINYYGAKRTTEALLPQLQLSDSPRIVNVSSSMGKLEPEPVQLKASGTLRETLQGAEECIQTNYYGAKRVTEALIPLLQLSDSPRIVNVSSALGNLRLLCNEWAKGVLSNQESLTEEKVDEVVQEFLKNFKEGALRANDWPSQIAAYKVSKAALNAYTRIMARKYPSFCINCVCPGFARTDITCNLGPLSASEAAESPVKLALLPDGGPSGFYFNRSEISSF
ncbi:UNVERIFIED_CONTAM: (-)-isopiperitenone reductase [Sesamum indicum]